MKDRIRFVLIITFCSVAAIGFLLKFSTIENHRRNGFVRLTPLNILGVPKSLDLKFNSYYIAGCTADHFYLGNYTAPTHVIISNYLLSDTTHLRIKIPESDSIAWKALTVRIDSPFVYLTENITPSILTGHISGQTKNHQIRMKGINSVVPISKNSFIARLYHPELKRNILAKFQLDSSNIRTAINILEKQVDGLFCTDGVLNFDTKTKYLTYVYYYRNSFVTIDTNLNVLQHGKTIDTVSHARIQVATISSDGTSTLSSPPLMINKRSSVSNGLLFVNSMLLAKNEEYNSLTNRSVVDVYTLKEGYYKFSFYIPNYKGFEMSYFKVIDTKLIAIFDRYILTYELNLNYRSF
jgi:hypothetical protein